MMNGHLGIVKSYILTSPDRFRYDEQKSNIDHWPRSRSRSNESATKLQARLLSEKGYDPVYYGFKGYSEPLINNVMKRIAEDGADEIIAVPLFISYGHYVDTVIPKRLGIPKGHTEATVAIGGRSVLVHMTEPFGYDPEMTDILLNEAMEIKTDGIRSGILLIGHGTKSIENQDMVKLNADRLREKYDDVYFAYNEFSPPTVEESLSSMSADGIEEVLALPLFVSSGGHTDDDLPGKLNLNSGEDVGDITIGGRPMKVRCARPVGLNPAINAIIESVVKPFFE